MQCWYLRIQASFVCRLVTTGAGDNSLYPGIGLSGWVPKFFCCRWDFVVCDTIETSGTLVVLVTFCSGLVETTISYCQPHFKRLCGDNILLLRERIWRMDLCVPSYHFSFLTNFGTTKVHCCLVVWLCLLVSGDSLRLSCNSHSDSEFFRRESHRSWQSVNHSKFETHNNFQKLTVKKLFIRKWTFRIKNNLHKSHWNCSMKNRYFPKFHWNSVIPTEINPLDRLAVV